MKLAILGGSFNPLHMGHVQMAQAVINELGYDSVHFVPAGIPPHKIVNGGANAKQRLQMVNEFCKTQNQLSFGVEDCEVVREGPSYTVDTVKYLTKKYEECLEGKLGLIMGEENASEFPKWKNVEEIVRYCEIIIVPREVVHSEIDLSEFKNVATGHYKGDFNVQFKAQDFPYEYKLLSKPVMTVSSTEIRARIANGKGVEELIPSCVYDYIMNNKLYK